MRVSFLFSIMVVSMLLAGCGGKKNADAAEVSGPLPTETGASEPPVRRLPYNHTESFNQEGNAVIGTRGYSRVCGGLAEHGVNGYDAFTWSWDIPVTVVSGTRLNLTSIRMSVESGAYGQVEGFLISPDGKELGRASFSGIGTSNEPLILEAPLSEGEYEVNVRVCGPDTAYRVLAEARYDE